MSFDAHKNFALATVSVAPSPGGSGTSLTVNSGQGALFPVVPFNATVWPTGVTPISTNAEVVRVTNIVGDVLTITRQQEGSSGRVIIATDQIAASVTVKTLTDAEYGAHRIVNVTDPAYGATGDGVTDDTAAIQAAVDAAGNNTVMFPAPSSFYKVTGLITVADAGQHWIGAGGSKVRIKWTACGSTSLGTWVPTAAATAGLLISKDDFSATNIHFAGPSAPGAYVNDECGIVMFGASASARLSGLSLYDCEISGFGAYGIWGQFVESIHLIAPLIHDCGYAGAMFFSCNHGRVFRPHIRNITPGTSGDAYGFSLTHKGTTYSSVDASPGTKRAPNAFCWDWIVSDGLFEEIDNTAIDAHGGYEVSFSGNRVYGCRRAISLSSGQGEGGAYSGWGNRITDNIVESRKADGTAFLVGAVDQTNAGTGIECSGGSTLSHSHVVVSGNTVRYFGAKGAATYPAIRATLGRDVHIERNIIEYWGGVAIEIPPTDCSAADNKIGGIADAADTYAACVLIQGAGTAGQRPSVVGNKHTKAGSGTFAREGLRATALTAERAMVEGNDFTQVTVPANEYLFSSSAFSLRSGVQSALVVTSGTTIAIGDFRQPVVYIVLNYAGNTTITDITGGLDGQIVVLVNVAAVTMTFARTNARLAGSANWAAGQYNTLTLIQSPSGVWYEIARTTTNG